MDRSSRNKLWVLLQMFGLLLTFAIMAYWYMTTLLNTSNAIACTFLSNNRNPKCPEIVASKWATLISLLGAYFTGFSLYYVLTSSSFCALTDQSRHQLYLILLEKTFYISVLLSVIVAFHSVFNAFLLLFCLFWHTFYCHLCYPEICIFQRLKNGLKKIPLAFYFPTNLRECLKPIAARSFLIKVDLSLFTPDFAQKALEEIECPKMPESIIAIPDLDDQNSRLFLVTMENPEDVQTILTNFLCLKLLFVFDFELHRILCYKFSIYCGSICEKAFYSELEKHNCLDFYFE